MSRAALFVTSGTIAVIVAVLAAFALATSFSSSIPPQANVVVAELFTSEGCSSCPPADALLSTLVSDGVDGVRVIGLSEHVDYWDGLGWRDPYSSPAFTNRQSEYARALGRDRIYTPQLVIDGHLEAIGSSARAVRRAVAAAARAPKAKIVVRAAHAPGSAALDLGVEVHVPQGVRVRDPAALFLVIAEDGLANDVRAGENRGRRLAHTAVVRTMKRAATLPAQPDGWSFDTSLPLESSWNLEAVTAIAFVQEEVGGRIVAAGAGSP